MAKKHSVLQTPLHFRVRPILLRLVVNALSLLVTVAIVPHVFFSGDYPILSWLLISAVFGLLNAFLKPVLQIIMLPLIFVSYGLVVVLINTVLLWTLAWIFTDRFHVQHILWAFVGGLVCGLVEGLLQNMLGLTPPIVEGGPTALKEEIARHKHGLLEKELLAVTAEDTPELATDALDEDAGVVADRSRGGGS